MTVKSGFLPLLSAALLLLAVGSGCNAQQHGETNPEPHNPVDSQEPNRAPGQYLVTLANKGSEQLAGLFAQYRPKEVRQIRDNLYLLHLTDDPGPETMSQIGDETDFIKAVEPNYIYGINPPREPFKRTK